MLQHAPRRLTRTVIALISVFALVAACGDDDTGSGPAVTGSGTPDLGTLQVAFASSQVAPANFVQIANGEGFYAALGLKVEIKVLNSPQATQALIAGQLDIAHAASPGINAALQGAPLKAIYTATPLGPYWVVAKPEIKDYAGLAGKVVGVYSTTGTLVADTTSVLQRHGVDAKSAKVSFSAAGGVNDQSELAAIKSGAYDAAVVSAVGLLAAQQQGLNVLGDFGDLPTMDWSVWTTQSLLQKRAAAIQAFVTGTIMGAKVYTQNPDRALKYVAAGLSSSGTADDTSTALAKNVMAKLQPILTPDGVPQAGQWTDAVNRRKAGVQNATSTPEGIADWSYAQSAAKTLQDNGFKP
ncbi:ABC transporter substrate-binding protein [Dactylosporangium sp. NPDC049525]|uniref:ABC transporter substrate-binding protein n=1 Tax=Dactylosporangium sp. NPDC049525 TaxID=3154730 RepID=UPI0034397EE2